MSGVAAEVDRAVGIVREAGLTRAADFISDARAKRWPTPEPWDLGACIWCEVDEGKRRKAIHRDQGGGPAMCQMHFDAFTAEPEPELHSVTDHTRQPKGIK